MNDEDRALLRAIREGQINMEEKFDGLTNEMHNRFDKIEEKLDELEAGQTVIAQRLFQSEKDIERMKRVK